MSRIALLLDQARTGDDTARQQAVALLKDDLTRLARCAATGTSATADAAALVQECYRRIADTDEGAALQGRSHFLALAGRAMRQVLVDRARARRAAATPAEAAADRETTDLLDLDAALDELARDHERAVHVVDCRLFGGLTDVETAEALRLPLRSVQRYWAIARERLQATLAG